MKEGSLHQIIDLALLLQCAKQVSDDVINVLACLQSLTKLPVGASLSPKLNVLLQFHSFGP